MMLVKGFKVDRTGKVVARYERLLFTEIEVRDTLVLLEELNFVNWSIVVDGKTVKTNFKE